MGLGITGGKRDPHTHTICQVTSCPKCLLLLLPPPPPAEKQGNPPSQRSLEWVTATGFSQESPPPLSLPTAFRGQVRHISLYQHPCPLSPQSSAFTQCQFYNRMGTFFIINKGSLHRN